MFFSFASSHPNGCKVVSQLILICILLVRDIVLAGYSLLFFGEMPVQALCPCPAMTVFSFLPVASSTPFLSLLLSRLLLWLVFPYQDFVSRARAQIFLLGFCSSPLWSCKELSPLLVADATEEHHFASDGP